MSSSVNSPEDLVNLALARIGFEKRIGSIYEGSKAAKLALTLYAQTRDELLRQFGWGFAERSVAPALLKQAPPGGYVPPTVWSSAYPVIPWKYEYAYPSDCLQVRSVRTAPVFLYDPDPQAEVFSVDNDYALSPPQKVVLCNIANMILIYTGQITDPTTWEADFIEAFAAALGRRLAPALVGMDPAKMEASDELASKDIAESGEG